MNIIRLPLFVLTTGLMLLFTACGGGGAKVSSVSISPKPNSMKVGEVANLTATVDGTNLEDKSVTWSSSSGFASVSNGAVTAIATGQVTITATSNADKSKADSVTVNIQDDPAGANPTATTVTINSKPSNLKVNETVALTALVEGTNTPPQTVSWSSSDPSVASVNAAGELKGLKAGDTVISATSTFNTSAKGAFNLTVVTSEVPVLKISSSDGTKITAGGGSLTLIAVKPEGSDSVSWSLGGSALGSLSSTTGDSVTYTPPATGSGRDTITARAGDLTTDLTITIETPPNNPSASRINGTIEDWTKTIPVLFTAVTNQSETLANDRVSSDKLIDMTFNTPTKLADLDGSFDVDICTASNELRSSPATLEGAIVYDITGIEETSNPSTVTLTQRSFVANVPPLDSQGFIFRVYSRDAGRITGNCNNPETGLRLEFDVDLVAGWNLVEAIYSAGNREFNVRATPTLAASMKLEAETLSPPTPTPTPTPIPTPNLSPYAYLNATVAPGFNQVFIDASYSYDPDGSITYWSLDMGDGNVLTSSTYGNIYNIYDFSYYYAVTGNYSVTLTVCDDDNECAYAYTTAYAY